MLVAFDEDKRLSAVGPRAIQACGLKIFSCSASADRHW